MRTFSRGKIFPHSLVIWVVSFSWMLNKLIKEWLQELGEVSETVLGSFVEQDLGDLLADKFGLRVLGVAGGLDLSGGPLGEANAGDSHKIPVLGLDLNDDFDDRVPFLDDGAKLFAGDVHAVEVGVAVRSFDFFNNHLHLSERIFLSFSLHVCEINLENATTETVSWVLYKNQIKASYFVRRSC